MIDVKEVDDEISIPLGQEWALRSLETHGGGYTEENLHLCPQSSLIEHGGEAFKSRMKIEVVIVLWSRLVDEEESTQVPITGILYLCL